MRGLIVAFVVLAACGDSPGVYLEIHGSPALAKVSVYIGQDACSDQAGDPCPIAPPNLDRIHPKSPGGTWYRDVDTPFTSGASGGVARVRIEATHANEVVQLVVLGLDGQGNPIQDALLHDVSVPQGTTKQVMLSLTDALPVTGNEEDTQPHPDGDYVLDWTSANAPSDCVLLSQWRNGRAERVFVVPNEDADCDGVLTASPLECDAFAYDFDSLQSSGAASCALSGHVGAESTCLLGGIGCKDGVGSTGMCAPIDPPTCVPDAVCGGGCDTGPLSSCVSATGGPTITCQIFTVADQGTPCPTGSVLAPTSGVLQLSSLFTGTTNTCKDVAFAPIDSLYGLSGNWTSMKLIPPATSTAEIDVKAPRSGACTFDLDWVSGAFATALTPQLGVADITVSNDHHMMLPVRFDYVPCGQAGNNTPVGIACDVPTSLVDGVMNCAQ